VRELAFLHTRILGNDESEAVAALTTVRSVLAHPFMTRARDAAGKGRCRRETPVTVTLADGTLVEGVLDLAFCDTDEWTVVGFKPTESSRKKSSGTNAR
jgi:ATP-dependent helicase/nuclease subunit A